MNGVPINGTDYANGWWNGGNATATGSVLGSFWNEINGTAQNNRFNAEQAALTRVYNSAEAQKDRDWQEYMSNTAYQRQVEDMKRAGINPASIGGDGASVPGGATASASPASASSSSGSGGVLGLLGGVARSVLAAALYKKFANSANRAPNAAAAVSRIGQDISETRMVFNKNGALKGSINVNRRIRDAYQ